MRGKERWAVGKMYASGTELLKTAFAAAAPKEL